MIGLNRKYLQFFAVLLVLSKVKSRRYFGGDTRVLQKNTTPYSVFVHLSNQLAEDSDIHIEQDRAPTSTLPSLVVESPPVNLVPPKRAPSFLIREAKQAILQPTDDGDIQKKELNGIVLLTEKGNNEVFVPKDVLQTSKKVLTRVPYKLRNVKPHLNLVSNSHGSKRAIRRHVKGRLMPGMPFSFQYIVDDEKTKNFQTRQEEADARGVVKGCYQVLEPTGLVRTVTYKADKNGFKVLSIKNEPEKIPCSAPDRNGRPTPFQESFNRNLEGHGLVFNNHNYEDKRSSEYSFDKQSSNNRQFSDEWADDVKQKHESRESKSFLDSSEGDDHKLLTSTKISKSENFDTKEQSSEGSRRKNDKSDFSDEEKYKSKEFQEVKSSYSDEVTEFKTDGDSDHGPNTEASIDKAHSNESPTEHKQEINHNQIINQETQEVHQQTSDYEDSVVHDGERLRPSENIHTNEQNIDVNKFQTTSDSNSDLEHVTNLSTVTSESAHNEYEDVEETTKNVETDDYDQAQQDVHKPGESRAPVQNTVPEDEITKTLEYDYLAELKSTHHDYEYEDETHQAEGETIRDLAHEDQQIDSAQSQTISKEEPLVGGLTEVQKQHMADYINSLSESLFSTFKNITSLRTTTLGGFKDFVNFPFVLIPITSFLELRQKGLIDESVQGFGAVIQPIHGNSGLTSNYVRQPTSSKTVQNVITKSYTNEIKNTRLLNTKTQASQTKSQPVRVNVRPTKRSQRYTKPAIITLNDNRGRLTSSRRSRNLGILDKNLANGIHSLHTVKANDYGLFARPLIIPSERLAHQNRNSFQPIQFPHRTRQNYEGNYIGTDGNRRIGSPVSQESDTSSKETHIRSYRYNNNSARRSKPVIQLPNWPNSKGSRDSINSNTFPEGHLTQDKETNFKDFLTLTPPHREKFDPRTESTIPVLQRVLTAPFSYPTSPSKFFRSDGS